MDILEIALVVLVIAGIWAIVEVALTVRSARKTIDEVGASANEVIEQATPIVAKLDGVVDELDPAIKGVAPIVEKADTAIDSANETLAYVNDILADVNNVTGTASNVGDAVTQVAESASNAAASVISKLTGGRQGQAQQAKLSESAQADGAAAPESREDQRPSGYVYYGDTSAAAKEQQTGEGATASTDGE